ncbi:hypothetical protein ACO0LB_06905 [Undibacterium sp. SXout7W]|uniref:hypothetical protein n=1 Tax=Undibacterium sp. SXout7W TaxID=3413049 RepID=UPI003BF2CDD2
MNKEKPTKEELEIIRKIFDTVVGEYEANSRIIFKNESERARREFGSVHRSLKNWSTARRCMVPTCHNLSIGRSHTIPKGMALTVISENSHVLVPDFSHKTNTLRLKKTGISEATTFPGFCTDHELLFKDFESKKIIDTEAHVYLQTYRTACRELFRLNFVIEQFDWTVNEYRQAREEGLLRILRERIKQHRSAIDLGFASMRFQNDPLTDQASKRVKSIREQAAHLENLLLPSIEKAVFPKDDSEIYIMATEVDIMIPVALAGSASFFVEENGIERNVPLLMCVVPQPEKTLIIFCSHSSNFKQVNEYVAYWTKHALLILSMIESWMINGTDQWCITPSVWNKIPESRRLALLNLLLNTKNNIGQQCELSIFDDIRKDLINQTDAFNAKDITSASKIFIMSEQKKME